MQITPIKTHKITLEDSDLFKIIDQYINELKEGSVLLITSKIVSIIQKRVVKIGEVDKMELIKKDSQYYLPMEENSYNVSMTITENALVASAGIDESNGNGYYILWPEDPWKVARDVREYLKSKFKLKDIGVIITDSRTTPLRWGITVWGMAHSGFNALNNLIGTKDIFGRELKMTKVNISDGLAAAGGVVMGEGSEQTPLALITEVPFVEFSDKDTSDELKLSMEDDLYAPLLKSAPWKKGEKE